MRTVLSFLVGAVSMAMFTTERGRKLADSLVDELEDAMRERIHEVKEEMLKDGLVGGVRPPDPEKEEGHHA